MKVAVFLAMNFANLGMYSVDRAAVSFFSRYAIPFDLFITQLKRREKTKRYGDMRLRLFEDATDISDYTHIVFWGDFQNNIQYGLQDFSLRDLRFGHSPDRSAAFTRWSKIYMNNSDLADGRPVLSVGNNFMSMEAIDPAKRSAVIGNDSYGSFTAIFPRDPVSTDVLRKNVPSIAPKVETGLDAAFLLNALEIGKRAGPASEESFFSYFFHRSKLKNTEVMASQIEEATGLKGRNLDSWLGDASVNPARHYRRSMHQVINSRFMISDTYHVCVNAINTGIPTFTISRRETLQRSTISDYKKVVLFDMLNNSERCFPVSDNEAKKEEIHAVTDGILKVTKDGATADTETLRRSKNKFEGRILDALHCSSSAQLERPLHRRTESFSAALP